ncbi:MAG: hypothetical protein WC007_01960 [Pelobacteraceae bacterium]
MTDRKKTVLCLAFLAGALILLFGKILFTDQIIRAPDITNEFYWMVKQFKELSPGELFNIKLKASWNLYMNAGATDNGGLASLQFLFYRTLMFWLIPEPASIAWFIVFHLFVGGAGTFFFCRIIGCSLPASFLGGLIFAAAPEIASLINAGHVQKIATISFAPWAFYLLERGLRARRAVIWFLACAVALAFQFFNMHWQIAYYTCLSLGVYGVVRSVMIVMDAGEARGRTTLRMLALNLTLVFFFLSTVAISLLPLASWSTESTRGGGAGSSSGGMQVEEAMSWSMPPEELVTFVIPGFFGLSREEGGFNTDAIGSYYWGRMFFTQTSDYMGVLPWLLLPLALIFRRDRYTWLALAGIVAGLLFSFGKYTPFYWVLFEHFPGISHFRVPKMMMIIPLLGLALLAARGVDCLLDEGLRSTGAYKKFLWWVAGLAGAVGLLYVSEVIAKGFWINMFGEQIFQPTRYEQGAALVARRWNNLVNETGLAAIVILVHWLALRFLPRPGRRALFIIVPLVLLYLIDIGRINSLFMLLQPAPRRDLAAKTEIMEQLSAISNEYRVAPLTDEDPMRYVSHKIPVLYTSNPVQLRRWQELLGQFSITSAVPDMLNVRYLVMPTAQYEQEKGILGEHYAVVYRTVDGQKLLLENRTVLPKAWLVPSVLVEPNSDKRLALLNHPQFAPGRFALVESPPPIPVAMFDGLQRPFPGNAQVTRYEGDHIVIQADPSVPSLLVTGDKYVKGWRTLIDGAAAENVPVNHVLRGVYLMPGKHTVEFLFDPLPFKIGKYLTLASFAVFAGMLVREWLTRRKGRMLKG